MAAQKPKLEACRPDRGVVAQRDAALARGRVRRRKGTGPPIVRLGQQAGAELAVLGAMLASKRDDQTSVERQVAALARTIARIGSNAKSLERDLERMRHHAHHDPLTGLPNRSLLLDRLDRALAQAERRNGQVALLMFDVDDFKLVNDRFGHDVGDRLLQGVAGRLQMATRDADTICRYGGDEFVILIPDADGRDGAVTVARKIRSCLAAPLLVDGHAIVVGACIGIAVYPEDGLAPMHLLQRADVAMYGAKDDPGRRDRAEDGPWTTGGRPRRLARRMLEVVADSGAPGMARRPATPARAGTGLAQAGASPSIRDRPDE